VSFATTWRNSTRRQQGLWIPHSKVRILPPQPLIRSQIEAGYPPKGMPPGGEYSHFYSHRMVPTRSEQRREPHGPGPPVPLAECQPGEKPGSVAVMKFVGYFDSIECGTRFMSREPLTDWGT
jgi:hypothetical protein